MFEETQRPKSRRKPDEARLLRHQSSCGTLVMDVWNVSQTGGGCTFGAALSAATSVVAIAHPSQHATKHFHATGHPIGASFEPGEECLACFCNYETQEMIKGPKLAPPRWHPKDQRQEARFLRTGSLACTETLEAVKRMQIQPPTANVSIKD